MKFLDEAFKQTRASVTPEMEEEYEKLADELKREHPRATRIGFAVPEASPAVAPRAPGPPERGKVAAD